MYIGKNIQYLRKHEKNWFDEAWEDYIYWQIQDKKTLNLLREYLSG